MHCMKGPSDEKINFAIIFAQMSETAKKRWAQNIQTQVSMSSLREVWFVAPDIACFDGELAGLSGERVAGTRLHPCVQPWALQTRGSKCEPRRELCWPPAG